MSGRVVRVVAFGAANVAPAARSYRAGGRRFVRRVRVAAGRASSIRRVRVLREQDRSRVNGKSTTGGR
jgi:hypothetical protein